MSIAQKEKEIIEEFSVFEDWMDRYEYIIDLGKEVSGLSEEEKTDDKLIEGCQSRVWLLSELQAGRMHFKADSDAIITKGIIGLLIRVLEGEQPEEIVKAELRFIDAIGLHEHLSPTRSNGLASMVKRIKLSALTQLTKG